MVVLITGVSSGFGLETARLLSQEGHTVYGTVRRDVEPLPGVHYLKVDDGFAYVDESPELFQKAIDESFGGDVYAFAEAYFATVADVVNKTGADITGHFDLFTKFNEDVKGGKANLFFDPSHPRYVTAWQKAVDALLPSDKYFEINTGGMASGRKTSPYPSVEIQNYIRLHGGKLLLSSDAHKAENLCFRFEEI